MANYLFSTSRLLFREFSSSDAEAMYALNADPEVIRYTGDAPFESVEAAKTFLESYGEYQKNGYGRWAVVLKKSGEFIGWCGLKLNEENMVDLGFRLFRKHWGKGYATEGASACLDYGFQQLQLSEIIGRAVRDNVASIRVLEKIGMQYWKNGTCHGFEDSVYYRIPKTFD